MTQPKRFQFTSTDGLSIACMKWGGHHDVRGVVQIAHGLGEHMGRYAELAETLLEDEFAVYGNDHRGHGLTAKPSGSFGEFGPGGFDQEGNLTDVITKEFILALLQNLVEWTRRIGTLPPRSRVEDI